MNHIVTNGSSWFDRSEYWAIKSRENSINYHPNKKHVKKPLIICGHGANLRVDRGTLFIRNGFTHYPQKREEFRFFRGEPDLPNRIIILDASGSITFDVLEWLNSQKIPLIHLNWQGELVCIVNSAFSADPKIVKAQYQALENGEALRQFRKLLAKKFENSCLTLKMLPQENKKLAVIKVMRAATNEIKSKKVFPTRVVLGIEGNAASQYFEAWNGTPIKWSPSRKSLVPADWHTIGGRSSTLRVRFESHIERARRRTRIMTEAA